MKRLSLRTLLLVLATAPLAAFVVVSGLATWGYYNQFASFRTAMVVQRLAEAGVKLALAMPAESRATPDILGQRRAEADKAFDGVAAAYQLLTASGQSDATLDSDVHLIAGKREMVKAYRAHVDAGVGDTRAESIAVLQPTSAAGLDLIRRSSATVDDVVLARFIAGYHALMQVNDASAIERSPANVYLKDGKLNDQYSSFVHHAANLFATYTPVLRESLPDEVVKPYLEFDQGESGKLIADVFANMNKNAADANYPAGTVDKWMAAFGERLKLNQQLIAKTGALLDGLAAERASTIRTRLVAYGGATLSVLLVVAFLCWRTLSSVSGLIRAISKSHARARRGRQGFGHSTGRADRHAR